MSVGALDFNVSGVEFVSASLAAAAEFFWLPSARLRRAVWACGNLFVLWIVLPNPASAAALAAFLLSGYAAARILRARPSALLLTCYVAALVAAFVVLKRYPILGWALPRASDGVLRHAIRITGLSYILFRQIHVLVDASQGQIEDLSLWSYVNYQLNLFTLLAGPIQRYQDFEAQWRTLEPKLADPTALLRNCRRLLLGVVKIALVAPFFYRGWDELQTTLLHYTGVSRAQSLVEFPLVLCFYPIYLYCNFSGYCDIVIATARFFGLELPENFDQPWLARNVIEFWTRWHITLGLWIRDYLFLPMYKPLAERDPKRAPSLAPVFYFAAFAVAGAWHGTTLNFLLYGAWQGLGMSATKLYENLLLARLGRQGLAEYLRSRSIRAVAIALNLLFQCVSLLIFSQRDVRDAWRLIHGVIS